MASWVALSPWVCEDFVCGSHDWVGESPWTCDGWICDVPMGEVTRIWWMRLGRRLAGGSHRH
jgi:hypothetical protein